jgi:hypothetical protein
VFKKAAAVSRILQGAGRACSCLPPLLCLGRSAGGTVAPRQLQRSAATLQPRPLGRAASRWRASLDRSIIRRPLAFVCLVFYSPGEGQALRGFVYIISKRESVNMVFVHKWHVRGDGVRGVCAWSMPYSGSAPSCTLTVPNHPPTRRSHHKNSGTSRGCAMVCRWVQGPPGRVPIGGALSTRCPCTPGRW